MQFDRAALPSEQYTFHGLPELSEQVLHARREGVFLLLSGLFLGSLTMLNILGLTRFLDLSFVPPWSDEMVSIPLAVGVLPYPLTFLCTDFIAELYGKKRASQVVWMGFVLNLWVFGILWLGGSLPGVTDGDDSAFFRIRNLAFGGIVASMVAYLAAQFVDVHLFHFWKRVTKGRHLWLRNNGSTLVSQLVDTIAVVLITHYYARALPMDETLPVASQLFTFMRALYTFKLLTALLDTLPFYVGTRFFTRYLRLPP